VDRIGEAALLAHLVEKPRSEDSAAQNVVHHDRREIIRVRLGDPAPSETEGRLGHVELDYAALANIRDSDLRRRGELRSLRPSAENRVKLLRERRNVDRADDRDLQIVARKEFCAQGVEVGALETLQRVKLPAQRTTIGVARKGRLAEGLRDHRVGIVRLAFDAGGELPAHAGDRLRLEARFVEREAKELEALVERARERLEMTRELVAIGAETEMDREILDLAVEGARVVGPRAFVEKAGKKG